MQPASLTTVRPDLAAGVMAYGLQQEFMGLKLLPNLNVQYKNGTYGFYSYAELTRTAADIRRAPGSEYYRRQSAFTVDTYACQEYGLEEAIDDGDKLEAERYFQVEQTKANSCMFQLMQQQELRIKTLIESTALFTSGYQQAVATKWNTAGSATPTYDLAKAKNKLVINSGVAGAMGQKLVLGMSYALYEYLVNVTEIKNCLGLSGNGVILGKVTKQQIAAILGVDEIVVSTAQASGSDMWDKQYAYLFYVSDSSDWGVPRLGNSLVWSADAPGNSLVENYRDESTRSDIVRVRQHIDEKVINVRNGILLTGCYAA